MWKKIVQRDKEALRRLWLRTHNSFEDLLLANQNPAQRKNTLENFLKYQGDW
jgi:hypothetical protein